MKFSAEIYEPMYDFNGRKYLRITVPENVRPTIENMHMNRTHLLKNVNVDDPLEGRVLRVKSSVPLPESDVQRRGTPHSVSSKGGRDRGGGRFQRGLECGESLGFLLGAVILDLLELLVGGLSWITREFDRLQPPLFKVAEGLEHTLKPKYLLGHLLDGLSDLLNVFVDVHGGHLRS